jgi:hypothetical protein
VYEDIKKEVQVQVTTPTPDDYTLINEYWLNEIKSQDDAIRHLINAVVVISGVYFTIILNNLEKIVKLPITYAITLPATYKIIDGTQIATGEFHFSLMQYILAFGFILGPPLLWMQCLRKAKKALHPSDKDKSVTLLENDEQSTQFLIYKAMKKHQIYDESNNHFINGMIFLIVLIGFTVFLYGYNNIPPELFRVLNVPI